MHHALALNLRMQAATPSDHIRPTFLLPAPPQFLNQAPPGAQQLTLPDFRNVPHFGHFIVPGTTLPTRSRFIGNIIGTGRRVAYSCLHPVRDIEPGDP